MPIYFNRTRGPLPLELRSGSRVVPPKGSIDISPEDEGSASVVRYVKKGFLIAPRIRPPVEPKKAPQKPEPTPAPAPKAAPAPKPAAKPAPAPKAEIKPAPAPELKPEPEPKAAPPPPKEEEKVSFDLPAEAENESEEPKKSSKPTRSRR